MKVRIYKYQGKRRININGHASDKYWVEKVGKRFAIRLGETMLWGFRDLKAIGRFIREYIGEMFYCDNCKKQIPKQKLSLWEDYATDRIYKTCPGCNSIVSD